MPGRERGESRKKHWDGIRLNPKCPRNGKSAADPPNHQNGSGQGRVQRLWLGSPCRKARVRDSLLLCESMGIKDCTGYTGGGGGFKLINSGETYYPKGTTMWFRPATISTYYAPGGGYVGYLDDNGDFHRITETLYYNYNKARLSWVNGAGNTSIFYDSTDIHIEDNDISEKTNTKTFLVKQEDSE